MRVDQIFEQAKAAGAQPVSFEMFPPKGEMTLERAREVAGSFSQLNPDFISVTYSAGGSGNNGATTKIAQMIDADFGIPSVAHLTCISLKRADLLAKIDEMRAAGIQNVLALRGDVPQGAPPARAAQTTATPKTSFPTWSTPAFAWEPPPIRKAISNATTLSSPCANLKRSKTPAPLSW